MAERATRPRVRPGPGGIELVVVTMFIVAAIATLTKIPRLLETAKPDVVAPSRRALAPAISYRLDVRLLTSAARTIPRAATYAVVEGDRVPSPFVRIAEKTLLSYWLLPRRRLAPRSSDWIVSIGGDLRSLGLHYTRVLHIDPGDEIAEVGR